MSIEEWENTKEYFIAYSIMINALKVNPEIDDPFLFNGGYGLYSSIPLTNRLYDVLEVMVS